VGGDFVVRVCCGEGVLSYTHLDVSDRLDT